MSRRGILAGLPLIAPVAAQAWARKRSVVSVLLTSKTLDQAWGQREFALSSPMRRWRENVARVSGAGEESFEGLFQGLAGGGVTLRWAAEMAGESPTSSKAFTGTKNLTAGRSAANWTLLIPGGPSGDGLLGSVEAVMSGAARNRLPLSRVGRQLECVLACLDEAGLRGGVFTALVAGKAGAMEETAAEVEMALGQFQDELFRCGLAADMLTMVSALPTGAGVEHSRRLLMGAQVRGGGNEESLAATLSRVRHWYEDGAGDNGYLG